MSQDSSVLQCVIVDDDPVAAAVIEHFIADVSELTLSATFESAMQAISSDEVAKADVLFLDVEMPGMTGLEMLDVMDDPPLVILVTSKSEYAIEAFDVDVVDYLLKPVTYGRFLKALKKIKAVSESRIESSPESDHVFVKSDGKIMKMALKDIEWIEAQRDYVLIHTSSQDYFIHSTMKRLSDRLGQSDFVRVHRSFIIRLDRVDDIQDSSIVMGKKVIPVGASYKENLMNKINFL